MQDMIDGRCGWCGTDGLYVKYHDEEWGRPVTDDGKLFELDVYKRQFQNCADARGRIALFLPCEVGRV